MGRERTFRDDWGRGKRRALISAADELDKDPGQVTTYGEMATWLRARVIDTLPEGSCGRRQPPVVEEADRNGD